MKLITELTEDINFIKEETSEGGLKNYFIEGVFLQGEIKNRNGRKYPMGILEREVNRYNDCFVKEKRAFGELGHPAGPSINLDRVSHMVTELRKDGNNYIGKAKIFGTPNGSIVKNFLDEGAKIGVSSRGMGSLSDKGGIMEVQDDFFLATAADIVADPSAPDAFVNGIMEGVEWLWDNGHLKAVSISDVNAIQEQEMLKKFGVSYETNAEQAAEIAKEEIEEKVAKRQLTVNEQLAIFNRYLDNLVKR